MLADYQKAAIPDSLKAILEFLEKLTLAPDQVGEKDSQALAAAGLTAAEVRDAVYVAFLFNVVDRLADAFEFEFELGQTPPSQARKSSLLEFGYRPWEINSTSVDATPTTAPSLDAGQRPTDGRAGRESGPPRVSGL